MVTFQSICFFSCFQALKISLGKVLHKKIFSEGKEMCSKETYETCVCKHICANRRWQPRSYTAVSPPVSTMTHLAQISLSLNCTLMSSQLSEKKGAKLLTSANLQFSWLGCCARFCLDNWLQLLVQRRACSVVRV